MLINEKYSFIDFIECKLFKKKLFAFFFLLGNISDCRKRVKNIIIFECTRVYVNIKNTPIFCTMFSLKTIVRFYFTIPILFWGSRGKSFSIMVSCKNGKLFLLCTYSFYSPAFTLTIFSPFSMEIASFPIIGSLLVIRTSFLLSFFLS